MPLRQNIIPTSICSNDALRSGDALKRSVYSAQILRSSRFGELLRPEKDEAQMEMRTSRKLLFACHY